MQATGAGSAIASQAGTICQEINAIHATLDGAGAAARDVGVCIREMAVRMNPADVTSRLTATIETITTVLGILYTAVQRITNTSSHAAVNKASARATSRDNRRGDVAV